MYLIIGLVSFAAAIAAAIKGDPAHVWVAYLAFAVIMTKVDIDRRGGLEAHRERMDRIRRGEKS